jgi:HEPN domain-containing protein
MVNIQKQIDYWRKGAEEEWGLAADLFESGRTRHALFFLHLAFEKTIKAHVCKKNSDIAPKDHNLVRLIEKTGLPISLDDRAFLATMTRFNIEGRYPDSYEKLPDMESIKNLRFTGERIYKWLLQQL